MAKEEKDKPGITESRKDNVRIPFTGVMEILASKISRKATIVAMAMVLIYLLAATPNVAEALMFIIPIGGLAIFFTMLQWILDVKGSRRSNNKRGCSHKDPPSDEP